jgi:hypothetical protein
MSTMLRSSMDGVTDSSSSGGAPRDPEVVARPDIIQTHNGKSHYSGDAS